MTTRRSFLTKGALAGAAAALAAPTVVRAQEVIKWRMQTYAGSALGEQVVKPAVDAFNRMAAGQMEIELAYADQLVPTGELFQAMQNGTIDCVQSDDDSMASPTEVTVFGGYFPLGLRYSLDVPALFNKYGLKAIWEEEYAKVGVKHISAGAWDPCHFATKDPINSLADLQGKRVFTFPTGHPAVGRHRSCHADGRAGRHRMVGHHRGLYRGLVERDQLLPHQQHLGCLDWPLLCQYGPLERPAAASAGNARHLL